jgi:hypothetical protein
MPVHSLFAKLCGFFAIFAVLSSFNRKGRKALAKVREVASKTGLP